MGALVWNSGAVEPVPVVSVVAADNYASEQSPPGITNLGLFTFTRTGDLTTSLTAHFSMAGNAIPGVDYSELPKSVTFLPGQTTATLQVAAIYSRTIKPMRTADLTLVPEATHDLSDMTNATVNIWHDDFSDPALPTVVIGTDGWGSEHIYPGGYVDPISFTVYRSGPTNAGLLVEYDVAGTAVSGVDFTGLSSGVLVPAGATLAHFDARPIDDGLMEGNETVIVTLRPTSRYQIGAWARAEGTINDDEGGPIPIINRGQLGMPGGQLSFRMNGAPGESFLIYTSTNLVDWSLAATNAIPGGGDFIEPSNATRPERRFFKAVPQ
ncbi:MAG: hypothetical protein QOF48_55 [Verrucomicrobiota bacterium]|jgi:hypothetical protein